MQESQPGASESLRKKLARESIENKRKHYKQGGRPISAPKSAKALGQEQKWRTKLEIDLSPVGNRRWNNWIRHVHTVLLQTQLGSARKSSDHK
jgi:hypothetical protein